MFEVEHCMSVMFASIPQRAAVQAVRKRLAQKAAHPSHPAVFLFVGDHGVGKTRLAYMMSLIMSGCPGGSRAGQPHGSRLFEVDGSSFGSSMDAAHIRKILVPTLVAHARNHPSGMILVNDVQLLGNALELLVPLITGGSYPEHHGVSFTNSVVVLTMDLNVAGTTASLSPDEITYVAVERLNRMPSVIGTMIAEHAHIVPFGPFDPPAYRQAIQFGLMRLPCVHRIMEELSFTDREVTALVRKVATFTVLHGNGRISAAIVDEVLHNATEAAMGAVRGKFRLQLNEGGEVTVVSVT
jgi:hypothetical protein